MSGRMGLILGLAVGVMAALPSTAHAQATGLFSTTRTDSAGNATGEGVSGSEQFSNLMNQLMFATQQRRPQDFFEDSQNSLNRAVDAFRAQQQQLLKTNETQRSVEVTPVP
ncbi:MAG: hypothetical protein IGQ88_07435 [Gloeomargaritaceae cyanobacterium C42_A2020_066]|nr:hypothetical protein [Gloeomargaritaceae cyanobacterium C42_A2020_066]